MKKISALVLIAIITVSLLAGCGKEAAVKTGLAVISSTASSKSVADDKGTAQIDSTVIAVILDTDGKIAKCVIDTLQTKVEFDGEGELITELDKVFETKNELKEEYGMAKASEIEKEWYEQAAFFAAYVEGKTLKEVKGIKVDEKGYPTETDLTSSVTMNISGYIAGIEKAVNNAKALGAAADDKLGLGIVSNIKNSKSATDSAEGLAQAYSTYTAITTNTDGKITSCIIDASQSDVKFSKTGTITTDAAAKLETKNERGAAYKMKDQSGIGKEWNEQAAAFATYVTGKTISEVKGIAIDDATKPTGTDLTGSVTITVGDFITAIEKANANVK